MSKLRNLIEQGPALCGAKNPERWAKLYLHAFDEEVKDKGSVFAHKENETIEDRLEILNGIAFASNVDDFKVDYWIDLITLCAYSYAVAKGNIHLKEYRDSLAGRLSTQEGDNLQIASVMSVAEASTLTQWA